MIGQTLGHYRITDQIGSGGMGVAYKAHDTRLDRDVVLKVMRSASMQDPVAVERFHKEALALAKLNHPNIGTIHEFATENGVSFLVMEFIPGQTLDDRISAAPIPEAEAVALGMQIASALEEAHEKGIIHRDLKPGNVLVTPKGQVKVVDFGLAKLLAPECEDTHSNALTRPEIMLGTVPYMAPEQLRGDAVDARTDLYALGLVLYEMVTQHRPFQNVPAARRTSAVLTEPASPPSGHNARVSPEYDRIVLKCLEKDPEDRYQSAKEVAIDLRRSQSPSSGSRMAVASRARGRGRRWWIAAGAAALLVLAALFATDAGGLRTRLRPAVSSSVRIQSLAVLPLSDLSSDSRQEYFADGMTDALITELSKIRALKVVSRTSVMQYKGTRLSMPEIARELGVDGVVEGSITRDKDQVRVSVQLIDGANDRHLWADSFQREMRDVLGLQSEIAAAIATEIKVAVTPDESRRLKKTARAVDPAAHVLLLQAQSLLQQRNTSREAVDQAQGFLQQAVALQPDYAEAYAQLATAYNTKASVGYMSMRDAGPIVQGFVEQALRLDPDLGPAYAARAQSRFLQQWDWAGAEADYKRAIELSPGDGSIHDRYSEFLSCLGRHDEALREGRLALDLSPLDIGTRARYGQALIFARRFDEAEAFLRKSLAIFPDDVFLTFTLGFALTGAGRYEEAIPVFLARKVPTADTNWSLGYAYGRAGRKAEARKVLEYLLAKEKKQFIWPTIIAFVYVGLGENTKAMEWFEKGFQGHEFWMHSLKVDPRADPIRNDPRFQDLLRRMALPD